MTQVQLFRHATDVKVFTAGQVIFREGEPGDIMYVVQEGEVDVRIGDQDIDHLGPGGIFGEMALIDSSARSATVIAAIDCRLVPIDERYFHQLVQQRPYFATEVMRVMARRLRRWMDLQR
jgi:CRP-like cAMP-binding protein